MPANEGNSPTPQPQAAPAQTIEALRHQAVATLTAAMVTASNRPHSVMEVLDIFRDIYFGMFPAPNSGVFQEWAKTRDARLGTPRV